MNIKVPIKTKLFAQAWALSFTRRNPRWNETHEEHDEWNAHGGFDLNLYILENKLVVTAYPLINHESGHLIADTSKYKTIVTKVKA